MITGIILAAGQSSRMGSPKALLDLRGETFVGRLVRVLGLAADPIIVALGYHSGVIRPYLPAQVRVALNPDPDRGQLSSLQAALAELPAEADGFFFTTVDCPAVSEETVKRVAEAFARRQPDTLFVIPRYGDRRGHPVCAHRSIASEFLALPPTAQARDVVHRYVSRTEYVDVDDPGILADIDDPEAYRRLSERSA